MERGGEAGGMASRSGEWSTGTTRRQDEERGARKTRPRRILDSAFSVPSCPCLLPDPRLPPLPLLVPAAGRRIPDHAWTSPPYAGTPSSATSAGTSPARCGSTTPRAASTPPTPASTRSTRSASSSRRPPTTSPPTVQIAAELGRADHRPRRRHQPVRPVHRPGHRHRLLEVPNAVGEVDVDRPRACRVQPGVVLDQLNRALAQHGLLFGPDVATASRATLGGMIGNNSAGARSVVYGKTVDHVRSLTVVLSDGTRAEFGPLDADRVRAEAGAADPRGRRLPRRRRRGARATPTRSPRAFPKHPPAGERLQPRGSARERTGVSRRWTRTAAAG